MPRGCGTAWYAKGVVGKGDVPTLVQPPGETPARPRAASHGLSLGTTIPGVVGGERKAREEGERESKVDYIISPPLPGAHPPFCEC